MSEIMISERNEVVTGELAALRLAGEIADQVACDSAFNDWKQEQSANTLKNAQIAINKFVEYLQAAQGEVKVNIPGDIEVTDLVGCDFYEDPECWRYVNRGLVRGFKTWLLNSGYAVATVNQRLTFVRRFCGLAHEADVISADAWSLIQTVRGVSNIENVNEQRKAQGIATRKGAKKAIAVELTNEQAHQLKFQPSTPQGRRDELLMCLLLDHGLRMSEVAKLTVDNVDLESGKITFARPKVKRTKHGKARHEMTPDTRRAMRQWFENGDAPAAGPLLRGSRKGGVLTHAGMSRTSITDRVKTLGEQIGVEGLSAHDCRHYCATYMAAQGYQVNELCDWFGWNSPVMAMRYITAAEVQRRYKG